MPRVRTHWSEPEDDGGRERDGREEDGWAAVVASGDAAPILQTAEHDLDAAAAPVAALVVSDWLVARSAARDAWLDALGFQGVPEPIGVITTVAKQPLCFRQIVEQGCRAGVGADLPGGHEEAQRPPIRIADGVQFGVHAAFRAADQAAEIPFFTRRLDAVRCAFR